MQTTYRLKAKELSIDFLESVKSVFTGKELEITVKSIESNEQKTAANRNALLKMMENISKNAPVIAHDVDIRSIIDDSHAAGF
ncbi:hypothetical protein FPZ43_06065 [Mucilaginibacter pallidiroseus]|uniref:Uncharacterized protein n=1 Tax=Mucilaginibacter pallidiroseus TaxID=2599295 RepID=A0A563UGT6_9SPHI|nr:hypothetical protein [Mucilaginibacter pallidiroseus]TWR30503.1 hypothetical protein FPZ43_06065 [Mucilaginibacter pallidiroseus]